MSERDASSFQGEVETHDQVGESLRILWRKVWSGLPPASEAALLPQGMQGQLPCKKGEGLCARQKVVELPVSRNIAISARMSSADDVRFGSGADVAPTKQDVRFTPNSGHQEDGPRCPLSANNGHRPALFDHLVGASKQRRRHGEAERLGGLEVNREVILCWRLHRQIGRLLTLEDAVDVAGRAPVLAGDVGPIGDQPPLATKLRYA